LLETLIVIAFTVIDQLVKIWAAGPLYNLHGGDLPLIEGVFHFTYAENRGAAFGMLQNARAFFIVLTIVVLLVLTVYMVKKRRFLGRWLRVALALIYAGALGNLIDRAILGYVRDMFDFRLINFYVFNVADACLTVGASLLILCYVVDEFRQKKRAKEEALLENGGAEAHSEKDEAQIKTPEDGAMPEETAAQPSKSETDIINNEENALEMEGHHAD
jgi:signal peptidase II